MNKLLLQKSGHGICLIGKPQRFDIVRIWYIKFYGIYISLTISCEPIYVFYMYFFYVSFKLTYDCQDDDPFENDPSHEPYGSSTETVCSRKYKKTCWQLFLFCVSHSLSLSLSRHFVKNISTSSMSKSFLKQTFYKS